MLQFSKKNPDNRLIIRILFLSAEREGFEPPVPRSTTVFKTAAIDHSAISPCFYLKAVQRYGFFVNFQIFDKNFMKNLFRCKKLLCYMQ